MTIHKFLGREETVIYVQIHRESKTRTSNNDEEQITTFDLSNYDNVVAVYFRAHCYLTAGTSVAIHCKDIVAASELTSNTVTSTDAKNVEKSSDFKDSIPSGERKFQVRTDDYVGSPTIVIVAAWLEVHLRG